MEEFNFERFTTSEVFKEKGVGNNICSDFILRTDYDLKERGLILDIHWYSTLADTQTIHEKLDDTNTVIYCAGREIGRRIKLVSPEEITNEIYEITLDSKPIMWNDAGEIINGRFFSLQEALLVKDKDTKCRTQKAIEIFTGLQKEHPSLTDESICKLFGYTPEAYTRACHSQEIASPFDPNPLSTIEKEEEAEETENNSSNSIDPDNEYGIIRASLGQK